MAYDDDRELTRYVWDHFGEYLTEFEVRMGRAILGRSKAANSDSPGLAKILNERWGQINDPEVSAALSDGPEAYRRQVRDRILTEHGEKVFVNRCPQCNCVVYTPRARQCFWCGHDWHDAESV